MVKTTGALDVVREADGSENWIDPVIGAHYTLPFNDTWSASLRGDIGGFGVGSDFAWQGIATLRWQATPGFGVLAAYRYMAMDYDNGSGNDYFKYDMAMSGPALGSCVHVLIGRGRCRRAHAALRTDDTPGFPTEPCR